MGGEILLILLAVLVLFGAEKLPGLARSLGKGLYEVKKATDEIKNELMQSSGEIRNELNQATSAIKENLNDIHKTATEPVQNIKNDVENVIQNDVQPQLNKQDNSTDIYKTTESGFSNTVEVKKDILEPKPENSNQSKV